MTVLVSVVVPTRRQPQLLDRCLHALVAQNFEPSRYEIIVADDADDPATKQQVLSWRQRIHAPTEILYVPVWDAHGSAAARNVGWRLATGRVIAFTDEDTIPRRDWLARGFAVIRGDVAAAAGRVQMQPSTAGRPDDALENENLRTDEFHTANCFVRRDVLAAIGGFDERFTAAWCEACDLLFMLLEAHGKVVAVPSAVVVRPTRPSRWGMSLRQQRRILFDALLYKKHAALYRGMRRAPRWDYYMIVLALITAAAAGAAGWIGVMTVASTLWCTGTTALCWRRMHETSQRPAHMTEMIATSILIPPLVLFWRLVGAIRFGAFVA